MEGIQFNLTLAILVLTGLISFRGFSNRAFFDKFKHLPVAEAGNKEYYRLLTSGFLHGDWMHLIFNGYVLLMFGAIVEDYFVRQFGVVPGRVMYLLMYITCIVAANIPSFLKHKNNPAYSAIGASGAVSGVIFISILISPMSGIGIIFIPIYIPAFIFGVLYLVYSSWAAKKQDTRIGHDAHFYGALYGMIFIILFNPSIIARFFNQIANGF
ncbi:rhomboid family intramembrane serine protease [Portibacter lacus]|uniref:Rhomboid family intramembrane serine protease n=1 Tax=Portibacter lacus TaxID=1099794 RepID=A0AA37WD50_9BACT|nr:rhomboid family intramembrane serine protease [Portibacter lacus]GLR15554.1 rhomboid family intramembrane serine protease [Portibacter lacus]